MKKLGLFWLLMILFSVGYAHEAWRPMWHRMDTPVQINIRHIDFFIFPNGEFDFNAHGRYYAQAGYMGVRIEKDRYGKIRRIGNVFVNYNRYGQVSRLGNVFIKYNRRGLVERVGRKRIRYHRGGYYVYAHSPYHPGYVSGSFYYGPSYAYTNHYPPAYEYNLEVPSYEDDYPENDAYDEDNYYYRSTQKKSGTKKEKVFIKNRRK